MKEIYLIRHASQDIRAFNEDVPLSDKGIRQARLLKDRLKNERYDRFYTSTLIRARETADILNENWHMTIETREELREIDYGSLSSEPVSVKRGSSRKFFEELERREKDLPFPGGENSEAVWKRTRSVFREIEESSCTRFLIVCHGGMIRASLCGLLDIPFTKRLVFAKHLENTGITELLFDEERKLWYLEVLNDHHHLDGHDDLLREI